MPIIIYLKVTKMNDPCCVYLLYVDYVNFLVFFTFYKIISHQKFPTNIYVDESFVCKFFINKQYAWISYRYLETFKVIKILLIYFVASRPLPLGILSFYCNICKFLICYCYNFKIISSN